MRVGRVESRVLRVESRKTRQNPRAGGTAAQTHRGADAHRSETSPALDSTGFTLIELLVVIAILTLLTAMTVAAVNFGFAAERSRSAARQVQSYLEGARDRAIYERRPVGVRFLTDPDVANSSTSMVFIEEIAPPIGQVRVSQPSTGVWRATRASGDPSWSDLRQSGLLKIGDKIRIPNEDGFLYTVQGFPTVPTPPGTPPIDVIRFEPEFRLPTGDYSFMLKLPPVVRANQEPMLLPRGIAIDLNRSRLPNWTASRRDVMFSPRGTVTGREAAFGLIHFYITETADIERLAGWQSSSDIPAEVAVGSPAELPGDRVIVTVFPQTGAISSHPVDVRDKLNNSDGSSGADTIADDPFKYAETGEVAGE